MARCREMEIVLIKSVLGLLLSAALGQSQLTVTWQGETVTGPLMIFHSEINQTVNSNSLTCRHPTGPVAWYLAIENTKLTTGSDGTFINVITNEAQIMRGTEDRNESRFDGLWTCRLNGATGAGAFHVGIYDDTYPTANGSITTVQGRSSPFITNPISFQLFGDSTGGPPTTSYWTRSGVNITNNSTFSTSISFTGSHDAAGHRAANYGSTLTVTGRQPGLYQYYVSNRRTTGLRTAQILVDGNPPTGLTLRRVSLDRVRVTWTDPNIRPRGGYRIEVVSGNINMTATSSPQEITLTPRSRPYEVTLVSLSRHYPINNLMENITLIDLLAPTSLSMSSLTATSVTISWTQPVGGLTVDIYRVTLTTRTSSGMCTAVGHTREETTTSTSIVIDGLEGNSIYTVTVSAVNNESNLINTTSKLAITTPAATPTGLPQNLNSTLTARSIQVTWNEISCIERNGQITGYHVEFGLAESGYVSLVYTTIDRYFAANGLTPFTKYSFRVRGLNSKGPGPYSNLINVTTNIESYVEVCPPNTFTVILSNGRHVCEPCPDKSSSATGGSFVCSCYKGYFRGHLETAHAPCTRPPSTCRNLLIYEARTRANSIAVKWERPLITGRDDFYYTIHYSEDNKTFTQHNINPLVKTGTQVEYTLSGLKTLTWLTIRVEVHNGVSDQDQGGVEERRCEVTGLTGDIRAEAPIGVLVLGNCSVVVWHAPRRAFGLITKYEVKFFIPGTSQNKVILKNRNVFFHLVTDSDTLPGPGDVYVQVRAIVGLVKGSWSEGMPLNC